ncbi:MAG: hypothetical protein V3T32_05130 [Thermodesulfobacteriota bacterium]
MIPVNGKQIYNLSASLLIGILALFLYVFIPSSVFAQPAGETIEALDCSIPNVAKFDRPGPKGSRIPVKVGFFVIDIKEIDDVEQTYRADIIFNITWNDPRLSEDALGKSIKNCVFDVNDIWSPAIVDVNRNQGEQLLDKVARVDAQGNVNMKQRYVGEFTSDLDFSDFPFDIQELHFLLAAYGPDASDIVFEVDNDYTGSRDHFSIEGWDVNLLDGVSTSEQIKTRGSLPARNFARIDFILSAERDKPYYIWKVITPLCLIVLMAWAVFWIDPKHLGPQIGLSTATVFTLIAYRFSIGFSLPKVSYFTRFDAFVFFSTLLVFIALGTAIATSKISADGKNSLAKKIEKYMRVIYLIAFVSIIVFTLLF